MPRLNLVQNIGFDAEATHTQHAGHTLARFAGKSLDFPLQHPKELKINLSIDQKRWQATQRWQQPSPTWFQRVWRFFSKME